MGWASEEGSASAYITATTLMEVAFTMLASPLPMPLDLAEKVRRYLADTPIELDPILVSSHSAIFDLELAVAYHREHAHAG